MEDRSRRWAACILIGCAGFLQMVTAAFIVRLAWPQIPEWVDGMALGAAAIAGVGVGRFAWLEHGEPHVVLRPARILPGLAVLNALLLAVAWAARPNEMPWIAAACAGPLVLVFLLWSLGCLAGSPRAATFAMPRF